MIRKGNALVIFLTISLLSGCSNKSFTNISSDLRKVDVLNKNKEIVKTNYQAFNKKVYDWLNVTCDFTKKKFKKIEDCKLTQLSKSFIKNQENENSPEKSNVNLILNKKLVIELIQNDFNHNNLLKEIKHLEDSNSLDKFLSGYKKLRVVVGNKNALDKVKENINKKSQVLVICAAGGRSIIAANLLANEGYNTLNVSDGFSGNDQDPGWKNLGLPSIIDN